MTQVIATQLLTSGTGSSGSSFETASISVTPNTLILAAIGGDNGGTAAPTTTIAGLSLTWTEITNRATPGGTRRITLFRAVAPSSASGTVTITHSGTMGSGTNWSFTKLEKIDYTGTNGANAIVQSATNSSDSATSLTATLSAFTSTSNATYGAIFKNGTEVIANGSGFTELGESNPARTIQAQFRADNDTSVDWSWSTNHAVCAIAVEIKYRSFGSPKVIIFS